MRDTRDHRPFEALLREHQRIVFKVARAYAHDPHDRDDLAQEIAVQLWRSFRSFDGRRAKFSTWMYRVALNVAISHVRNGRRPDQARFESLEEGHHGGIASPQASHAEALEHTERLTMLHAFIERLDPLNRALVVLYLEDRSYAEIAEVLGISETNVATKLNRIRQKLRDRVTTVEGEKNGTR